MYAIIEVGGKQYKVEKDDVIDIDRQNLQEGETLVLDNVLLVSDNDNIQIGRPNVSGAKVKASVLKNVKARKVIAFQYRRRKDSHRKTGHRRMLSKIKIEELSV